MKKGFRAIVFYIFLSIVIIKPGMIHAQQEVKSTSRMSFSLQQAQDYAYENNYDLRNSAYDVQIAKKTVRQNISIGLPQINGGADYMNYFLMPTQMIPNIFAQPPKYDELIPVQF
jgi:outer membrane protein